MYIVGIKVAEDFKVVIVVNVFEVICGDEVDGI